MATEHRPTGIWETLIGFFIDNRVVVAIGLGLLMLAGISFAPFRFEAGPIPRDPIAVDALPDISENQQIVFTKWPGRSPRDVEDQITYPLTTALLGIAGVKTVRSSSALGFSSIYVIFEDDVDFYWARSRILEKLAALAPGTLPESATPTLGPDATALGQVFWYTLEARTEDGEPTAAFSAHELRAIQDFQVRYALQAVDGVSEVSSIGGFVREYQVDVDPHAMLAHGVTIGQVAKAVGRANLDVGARTIEINRVEYLIRGLGFIETPDDLEKVVIDIRDNTPIRVADVAKVGFGPAERRGTLDVGGAEGVGGVVVARYGGNPMAVIEGLRNEIDELSPGLPKRTLSDGRVAQVQVVPFYDRTQLIDETLETLSTALLQQIVITAIVVLVMLRRFRSSVLITGLLPAGVLATFVAMRMFGIDANVMALAGIAIAIGTMVDLGIVVTENITQHLDRSPDLPRRVVIRRATAEVAPAVTTAVLTTVIGFVPVFGLTGAEGKLFGPLAWTKSFALLAALVVAVVVLPALAIWVLRARERHARSFAAVVFSSEFVFTFGLFVGGFVCLFSGLARVGLLLLLLGIVEIATASLPKAWSRAVDTGRTVLLVVAAAVVLAGDWQPVGADRSTFANLAFVTISVAMILVPFALFQRVYPTLLRWCLQHRATFFVFPVLLVLGGATIWLGAERVLPFSGERTQKAFPGLERDFMPAFDEGAFLLMPTTTPHASIGQAKEMLARMDAAVEAIPEVERAVGKLGRADSALDPAPVSMFETIVTYKPEFAEGPDGRPVRQWRDHIHSPTDIWKEITEAARMPGLTGAPKLMPIQTRIIMLQSGMRSPLGLKIRGPDLESIERFALDVERLFEGIDVLDSDTVAAQRVVGKPYLEIDIDRDAISRYGLSIGDVQDVIQIAIGGRMLTQTVEGRERFPVRVRYMREERDNLEALHRILVPTPAGQQIPLEQLADIHYVRGPQMIKSEDTFLTTQVTFDTIEGVASVTAVEESERVLQAAIKDGSIDLPDGVSFAFAGTYENQVRSEKRLAVLIPVALAIIFVLLYIQFRRISTVAYVFSGVLVSAAGGMWLLWFFQQGWFLDAELAGLHLRSLFNVEPYSMTVAVWVGFLALFGIATDDGVVMTTYLEQRFADREVRGVPNIRTEVVAAAQRRIRPCLMTTATTALALLPVITSTGRGADLMVPMAIPLVGGMLIEVMTLFVVPLLWSLERELMDR